MFDKQTLTHLVGATVRDSAGAKVGKVGQVYLDDATGQPEWVTVQTGLLGTKESFAPLEEARFEGDELSIPVSKDQVREAPSIEQDGHMTEQEEEHLYRYYGLTPGAGHRRADVPSQRAGNAAGAPPDAARDGAAGAPARARTGRHTEEGMVRSEEHLHAGTERVATGRMRLRKYVVTDTEQVTVPVSREEVRVEREPIREGDRGRYRGDISEAEQETTLHAERPVVETRAEPVERVRLDKRTVRDEETVSGQVRREEFAIDDDTSSAAGQRDGQHRDDRR